MREFTEYEAIRNLQRYLRQLSYEDADIPPVPIDGIFESATEEALRAFQIKRGLEATGIADRETWDALYEDYLESLARFSPPKPFSPFFRLPEGDSLSLGDVSFAVAAVQFLLNESSQIIDTLDQIVIDGIYGNETRTAVSRFQEANGMLASGEVDKNTWDALVDTYNRYGNDYMQ